MGGGEGDASRPNCSHLGMRVSKTTRPIGDWRYAQFTGFDAGGAGTTNQISFLRACKQGLSRMIREGRKGPNRGTAHTLVLSCTSAWMHGRINQTSSGRSAHSTLDSFPSFLIPSNQSHLQCHAFLLCFNAFTVAISYSLFSPSQRVMAKRRREMVPSYILCTVLLLNILR